MDTGKVDLVIELPITKAGGDPDLLENILRNMFFECAVWVAGKLDSGEASPPATIRLIGANGQCFSTTQLDRIDGKWDGQMDEPKFEKDFAFPFFAVIEDAEGRKFVARVETDRDRSH